MTDESICALLRAAKAKATGDPILAAAIETALALALRPSDIEPMGGDDSTGGGTGNGPPGGGG